MHSQKYQGKSDFIRKVRLLCEIRTMIGVVELCRAHDNS